MSDSIAIVWAAGLFEGEGNMDIRLKSKGIRRTNGCLRLRLGMTDEDVVRRFYYAIGMKGIVYMQKRSKPHYKDVWVWTATGKNAAQVLALILPHLGNRRYEMAENLLKIWRPK